MVRQPDSSPFCAAIAMITLFGYGAVGQELDGKRAKIARVLEIQMENGGPAMQIVAGIMLEMENIHPNLPKTIEDKVINEAILLAMAAEKNLIEKRIDIWDRELTSEEVDYILSFYDSSIGRSIYEKMTAIDIAVYEEDFNSGVVVGAYVRRRVETLLANEQ